jgi:hypothetical protein
VAAIDVRYQRYAKLKRPALCFLRVQGRILQVSGLMRVASEAADLQITISGIERVTQRGDGCAGPRNPSMRLFQASHASLSASFRATVARCSDARTELPKRRSRDLVPMGADNAPGRAEPASRYTL